MVPRVQPLCSQSRTRNLGQMHQYNVGALFKRIATDVARTFPPEQSRKPIPSDRYGLFYKVAGSLCHSQSGGFDSSRSYLVTRAITSNLACCRKFCNSWEWARRALHLCTAVGRHGRALHQDDRGAPMKGHCIPLEGLGCKKTRYDKLANCAGYHEGDGVWLYHPTRTKRNSLKLQSSWEGPYKVINDVIHRIQRNPRSRMMVVHLDGLVS
jgi:hypothetical protein